MQHAPGLLPAKECLLDISSPSCLLTGMITVKPIEHEVSGWLRQIHMTPALIPCAMPTLLMISQARYFDVRHLLNDFHHSGGCSLGSVPHHHNHGDCRASACSSEVCLSRQFMPTERQRDACLESADLAHRSCGGFKWTVISVYQIFANGALRRIA